MVNNPFAPIIYSPTAFWDMARREFPKLGASPFDFRSMQQPIASSYDEILRLLNRGDPDFEAKRKSASANESRKKAISDIGGAIARINLSVRDNVRKLKNGVIR